MEKVYFRYKYFYKREKYIIDTNIFINSKKFIVDTNIFINEKKSFFYDRNIS